MRAEAALELLRSLAKAGNDPEQFAQACLDWSRLSDDATTVPDFMSVLSMLSDGSEPPHQGLFQPATPMIEPNDMFSINADGRIEKISRDLTDRLGLAASDPLHPDLRDAGLKEFRQSPFLIELPDRYAIKRQIKVHPVIREDQLTGYIAHAVTTRLDPAVRAHLRLETGLTSSEIEILELVLQRYNLDQIADLRGIKLNTVRTHVARLISKLDCHSLVEAVATTLELANALKSQDLPVLPLVTAEESKARMITLDRSDQRLEYRRYGPSNGRPVIVLHSLEYGYLPSHSLVDLARQHGLNLIFPIRPGFGRTSRSDSLSEAADILSAFVRALNLTNVTLVGLSTAAPLALKLQDKNPRIQRTLLINYGLNVRDKLAAIQPKWIGGMVRMALSSNAGFAFWIKTLSSTIKTFGGLRFYRLLYRNQTSDQDYLNSETAGFQIMSDYVSDADSTNVRLDIETAFLANHAAETLLSTAPNICVMNSSDQHGVGPEESQADAERLGVAFRQVPFPGRNWIFQHPDVLINELMDD